MTLLQTERVARNFTEGTVKLVIPNPVVPPGAPALPPTEAQRARLERLDAQARANGVRVFDGAEPGTWKVTSQQRDMNTGHRKPPYRVEKHGDKYVCGCAWGQGHIDSLNLGEYGCAHVMRVLAHETRKTVEAIRHNQRLATALRILGET